MQVDERERPQGVADLEEALDRRGSEPVPTPSPTPSIPPERAVGAVFRDPLQSGGEGPEMVVLPTGRLRMGDLSGEGEDDERPVRTVTIHRPIVMGKYPVTFEEYDRFVNDRINDKSQDFLTYLKALFKKPVYKPNDEDWGRGTRPVIYVSQKDAKAYAVWLSEQTGKLYRLPSEAEWEYAARAGTTTEYSWGDEIGRNRANCAVCGSKWDGKKTAPVGSFAANPFGLHDMHGNVYEWVEDCWHNNYDGAPTDGSVWADDDCEGAVARGGSWGLNPRWLRSAGRLRLRPSVRVVNVGFRLVQDLTP